MHTQRARNGSARPRDTETRRLRCRIGRIRARFAASAANGAGYRRLRCGGSGGQTVPRSRGEHWSAELPGGQRSCPGVSGVTRRRPGGCPVTPTATPAGHPRDARGTARHPGPDGPADPIGPGNRETAGVPAVPRRASHGRRGRGSRARYCQRRPASSTRAELPMAASASRMRNVASRKLRFIVVTTAPRRSRPFRDGGCRRGEHEARQDRLHVPLLSVRRAPGNRAVFRRPEDPWLCVPASRRVCPGREPIGQRPSLPSRNYASAAGRAMRHRYQRTASRISR